MWFNIFCLYLFIQLPSFCLAKRTKRPPNYGSCEREQYRCANDKCINKYMFCNGIDDCGDKSDESFCSSSKYPEHFSGFACENKLPSMIIPQAWRCDGIFDCRNKRDEGNECSTFSPILLDDVELVNGSISARQKAADWLRKQQILVPEINGWGAHVPRVAVALYLANPMYFNGSDYIGNVLTYKIQKEVLARILRNRIKLMPANELALYIHALLVTCANPQDFHGTNLVAKLRSQVDRQENYLNPLFLLALCNAKDNITVKDVRMLLSTLEINREQRWLSIQALVLMTLGCIAQLPNSPISDSTILSNLSLRLKKHQDDNGGFQNVYTTALVMQALFASGTEDDGDWNMEEAVKYLVKNQKEDGAYGNILSTYFALPVLHYKTLTNISTVHCRNRPTDNRDHLDFIVKYFI